MDPQPVGAEIASLEDAEMKAWALCLGQGEEGGYVDVVRVDGNGQAWQSSFKLEQGVIVKHGIR